MVPLEFFIDIIDLGSNRNDYKKYFLRVKEAGS
jgi:hypothetical protein